MFDNLKKKWFRDEEGGFEDGGAINKKTRSRNQSITVIALVLVAVAALSVYKLTQKKAPVEAKQVEPVEFGAIIESDFTDKDNQSALMLQQQTIDDLTDTVKGLVGELRRLKNDTLEQLSKNRRETERAVTDQVRGENQDKIASLEGEIARLTGLIDRQSADEDAPYSAEGDSTYTPPDGTVVGGETFGARPLPPRPSIEATYKDADVNTLRYNKTDEGRFAQNAFDSFDFFWQASVDEAKGKRNIDNYVPTGTFVTAVVTGGADANAGVLGQGDTSPIVFQTVNEGILPNGQKSKLGDCTITGSVYGEISSSRGITRTHRMSCIQPKGDILDIPVRGTAFNFGRNGIRGTTILKNGEIVQMAGVAGILTGLGETGKALSQSTSTSALGSVQTIQGEDAALNLLGNATSSVGAKLADYYIKLAEMYHPIVEVNPGAVVNIVFLDGFPLDPLLADDYEAKVMAAAENASRSNSVLDVIGQVMPVGAQQGGTTTASNPTNPLANDVLKRGIQVPAATPVPSNSTPTSFGVTH